MTSLAWAGVQVQSPASSRGPEAGHLQSLDPRLWLGGHSRVDDGRGLEYPVILFYFFTGRGWEAEGKRVRNSRRTGMFQKGVV